MPRSIRPERPSAAPSTDDRSTERKLSAAPSSIQDSSRSEVVNEDFLFHLYRGSELLQDNRVHEAKEELEHALMLQPSDSKGQDLLAAVYFRLGIYPRAITIYENLSRIFPRDTALKVNLSLCFLKLARFDEARAELVDVVSANPSHRRAWAYLGVAHEKLGDLEQAQIAFERGGQPLMAKRMSEKRGRVTVPAPANTPDLVPGGAPRGRSVQPESPFAELDAGDLEFAIAEAGTSDDIEGWHTVEPGAPTGAKGRSPFARTIAPAERRERDLTAPPPMHYAPRPTMSKPPSEMTEVARASLLAFPADQSVMLHPSGVALVQVRTARENVRAARSFAARLESMRAAKGEITTAVMQRRVRDKDTDEVLGGIGSPLVRVDGDAEMVLGPRPAHHLVPLSLDDDLAFVREDLLLGFELSLAYENGRLSLDENDPMGILQLRGTGSLVLELLAGFTTLDATVGRGVLVRREWIVGWIGRLIPRIVPPGEAPAGQRGLVGFRGEGTVLLAGR
jgi:Flp pilus assembly protein TadD